MESPKQLFQQHTESVKAFRELIAHPAMKVALLHAQAELIQYRLTPEQLSGARQFISVLCNLGENEPPQHYPVKQLEVMDLNAGPSPEPTKKKKS